MIVVLAKTFREVADHGNAIDEGVTMIMLALCCNRGMVVMD